MAHKIKSGWRGNKPQSKNTKSSNGEPAVGWKSGKTNALTQSGIPKDVMSVEEYRRLTGWKSDGKGKLSSGVTQNMNTNNKYNAGSNKNAPAGKSKKRSSRPDWGKFLIAKQEADYAIGIDSGTNTGIGIWDCKKKKIVEAFTLSIHRAMEKVRQYYDKHKIIVIVEDASQATHGRNTEVDKSKAMGAGSVIRDSRIWQDFLEDYKIPYIMQRPNKNTKEVWNKEMLAKLTGYAGLTSQHARDACGLVYGY